MLSLCVQTYFFLAHDISFLLQNNYREDRQIYKEAIHFFFFKKTY